MALLSKVALCSRNRGRFGPFIMNRPQEIVGSAIRLRASTSRQKLPEPGRQKYLECLKDLTSASSNKPDRSATHLHHVIVTIRCLDQVVVHVHVQLDSMFFTSKTGTTKLPLKRDVINRCSPDQHLPCDSWRCR